LLRRSSSQEDAALLHRLPHPVRALPSLRVAALGRLRLHQHSSRSK